MKKKSILALTLAGLVVLQTPMTALAQDFGDTDYVVSVYADGGTFTNIGSVTVDGTNAVQAENGAAVQVNRSVSGRTGVYASGTNTTVSIGEDAKGDGWQGVYAESQASVTVGRNASSVTNSGVAVNTGASVTVNGNATSTNEVGVWNEESTVIVKGNAIGGEAGVYSVGYTAAAEAMKTTVEGKVQATGDLGTCNHTLNTPTGIYAAGGTEVYAGRVESAGVGIDAAGAGTVVSVDGSVKSTGDTAVIIAKDNAVVNVGSVSGKQDLNTYAVEADNAAVTVNGAVKNDGVAGAVRAMNGAVVKAESAESGEEAQSTCYTLFANSTSVIVISGDVKNSENTSAIYAIGDSKIVIEGTVESNGATYNAVSTRNNAEVFAYAIKNNADNTKLAGKNVHYIVRTLGSADAIEIQSGVETSEEIADKTYDYADEGDTIVFSLKTGYDLYAPLASKNADGTYTIVVPAGGGVSIKAVLKAIEEAERKASFTGSEGNAVSGGTWNCGPGNTWTYRTDGIFRDTWGYITLENGKTGWFWFDKSGIMATGWKEIGGKWYYFNEAGDGTQGMMLVNTTTPDGYKVGADGARIQ